MPADTASAFLESLETCGGETGRMIAARDWSETPLGPVETWPQSLRTLLGVILRSPVGMVVLWGEDGIMLYNDAYCGFAGGRHPQLLGSKVREGWPEVADFNDNVMKAVLAGGTLSYKNQELTLYRHGAPEQVTMNLDYSPVPDESGRPAGVIAVVVETTQGVQAEQTLKAEREQFARLFEESPTFMAVLRGPEHVFEYCNPSYLQLIGHRDLIGKPAREAVPEAESQGYFDILDSIYRSGEAFRAQSQPLMVQRPAGGPLERRVIDFLYQPIPGPDGAPTGIFVEGVDVTEREQTASELRQEREYRELMLNSLTTFAIISFSPEGRIVSWSPGAEAIFGYTADEAIGQPSSLLFTPEDNAAGMADFELERAARDSSTPDERWHLRKDGSRFYASGVTAAMHDETGGIRGFVKMARDMSEQKRAEEDVIAARNAAEAANMAKSEFLANMSHEIRTPMNAVIGLSNLLAMSSPLTSRQKEFIRTLQTSANSLLSLINDLLDVAKIEANSIELEQVPFNLTHIVEEVSGMLAVRLKEKGLSFTSHGECVKTRNFIGDPTRIRQIILNLCGNAVKFTESGGVDVSITCHPTEDPDVETIAIAVTDTGIGIAPDKLQSIFEKFVQADSSISRKYGGTGLGLAITKTLTEVMGGTITVKSTPGQGSTFEVRLPLAVASREEWVSANLAMSELKGQTHTVNGPHVLLVEDHAPNILVARNYLEEFGYRVTVAESGMEAFEALRNQPFAAVLMDVQMPGMNGFETTRLIRKHEMRKNLPPVPIIGMTAHAMAGDRERCLAAGMTDYLSKPFNPDDLQAKLDALVRDTAV